MDSVMQFEERSQIPEEFTWDLSSAYPSDEAFLKALEVAQSIPAELAAFRGTISADPEKLLAYIEADVQAGVTLGKLANYAQRKSDEDTRDARYQDFVSQVMTLYVAASAASAWFASEFLEIPPAILIDFYKQEPRLEKYRRMFDRLELQRAHVLSPAEEAILAQSGEVLSQPEHIFSLFNDADLTFPDAVDAQGNSHTLTQGTYVPLMTSQDRVLRESAYINLYDTYKAFRNTSAAILGAQEKSLLFSSSVRHYVSPLEASLKGNEVPLEVYRNLIKTVNDHLDTLHSYVDLRKRALGLDQLHFWDLYVPIVDDVEMEFTYKQACEIIIEALQPMGSEYVGLVKKALSERWVDVYETPGKRTGAYSAGSYGMHPVMLLNFQGKLDDVFTLIHEMGHSIHTYLSCQNQDPAYSDYVIFVAEVASTCNEALLMEWFLANTEDKKQRAYLLNHYLEQFRATLYRQTMFAEFELKVSELTQTGAGITADALDEMYGELNRAYYGEGIVTDDRIAGEWERIPHFYYDFYVYQYATGYAAALALSQRILNEGAPAVADYVAFLSGGSSKPPLELLRGAGVDMTTPAPIEAALNLFASLIKQMEELLDI